VTDGRKSKPSALAGAIARISESEEAKLELEREANQTERDRVRALTHDQKRKDLIRDLRLVARTFEQENSDLRLALSDLTHLAAVRPSKLKIRPMTQAERRSGQQRAIPVLLLSDLHLEEEVQPERVGGLNKFNLEIASESMDRLIKRWVSRIISLERHSIVKEAVLWLGGDLISNVLHEESFEINLLSPIQALEFAFEKITRVIDYTLDLALIERLILPTNHGNHGRINTHTKSKIAAEAVNNHEWGLYIRLAKHYANEPRVSFRITDGYLNWLQLGSAGIRFHHGHQIGGAGGDRLLPALLRRARHWDLETPPGTPHTVVVADVTCSGHFHQYIVGPGICANGSLIGYNAFGIWINAPARDPVQASFVVYPDNPPGYRVSEHYPILVR